jgi:Ca-activated chloride channel family protein
MRATVSTMRASGATAMYEGLRDGMREVSRNFHPHYINHLVLITDGHTYGDADSCLELADEARAKGVAISAMGIGEDWNDEFLDQLASRTGGSSAYIASHRAVTAFVEDRIRSLGTAYAERVQLVIAPAPGVKLDSIFKVSPDPLPLDADPQPIPLGLLDVSAPTSLIAQFSILVQDDAGPEYHLGRILADADILMGKNSKEQAVVDLKATVTDNPVQSRPPTQLLQALSKVTLYRLQEHARTAIEQGDIEEATRSLRLLSTRLLERGEEELALEASREADRVAATREISNEGHKSLKYGTRALIQQ